MLHIFNNHANRSYPKALLWCPLDKGTGMRNAWGCRGALWSRALPPFAGFLALKKPRMTRYMAQKEYFKNRQAICRCVLPNFCATKV